MFKVRRKRCASCIYGPPAQSASAATIKQLEKEVADPRMKGHFRGFRACHKHLSNDVCCRGFWDRHKDHFDAGQLAQRLNVVQFVDDHERKS